MRTRTHLNRSTNSRVVFSRLLKKISEPGEQIIRKSSSAHLNHREQKYVAEFHEIKIRRQTYGAVAYAVFGLWKVSGGLLPLRPPKLLA